MAYIQERKTDDGKTHYRVQVRLRGHPTTTATFERKTDAKLWAQQTESAMREGRHFKTAEAKKHSLAELVDRYIRDVIPTKPKNAAATTAQLQWWKKEIGHCLLSDLTPALIAEQRDHLLKGTTFKRDSPLPCYRCTLPCRPFTRCDRGSKGVGLAGRFADEKGSKADRTPWTSPLSRRPRADCPS